MFMLLPGLATPATTNAALTYQKSKQAAEYAERDWQRRLDYQARVYASQDAAATANMTSIRLQAQQQRQAVFDRAHQLASRLRAAAGDSVGYGGTYNAVSRQAALDEARAIGTLRANEMGALRSVRSQARQYIDIGAPPPESNPGMDAFVAFMGGVGQMINLGLGMAGGGAGGSAGGAAAGGA